MDGFVTERLSICNWRSALEESVARHEIETVLSSLLSHRVLEHLPPPLHLNQYDGDISSWMDDRVGESDVFLVRWKLCRELIGLLMLASGHDEGQTPSLHIGYLLGEASWGQGIATELVLGLVSAAGKDGPVRLLGGVSNDNPASARVLGKAGFELSPDLSTQNSQMFAKTVG